MLVEWIVLLATLTGLTLGAWAIYWARVGPSARRARWGRRLFVMALLMLGSFALLAALMQAGGLVPLGLLSGLLIVGMLWEGPAAALDQEAPG